MSVFIISILPYWSMWLFCHQDNLLEYQNFIVTLKFLLSESSSFFLFQFGLSIPVFFFFYSSYKSWSQLVCIYKIPTRILIWDILNLYLNWGDINCIDYPNNEHNMSLYLFRSKKMTFFIDVLHYISPIHILLDLNVFLLFIFWRKVLFQG